MSSEFSVRIELVPEEDLPAHQLAYEQARRRYERFRDGGDGEGPAGVREPRRPSDSPPGLAAEFDE